MKIDLFTHVLPKPFLEQLERRAGGLPVLLQRIIHERSALYDIDLRRRVMDRFEGYAQILTLSVPPVESFGSPEVSRDLAAAANDSMAALVADFPDQFLGFVASPPMDDVDAALVEIDRAVGQLGAVGAHICTNINGVPLDDARFEPFFAKMAALDRPIWVHPYRTSALSDYPHESTSLFGMWLAFGWPYETTVFASRLIMAGILDRYPNLRIVTHHAGGMLPQFAHRIGAGLADLPAVGRPGDPPPQDHAELQQRIIERYRWLYADTSVAAAPEPIVAALSFFGVEQVVFATDMPFDPENGPAWIRDTIALLDSMDLSDGDRQRVYRDNAHALLRPSRPEATAG